MGGEEKGERMRDRERIGSREFEERERERYWNWRGEWGTLVYIQFHI